MRRRCRVCRPRMRSSGLMGNLSKFTREAELLFTVIGAIAQFERALLLERQRESITAAKAAGRYRAGRRPRGTIRSGSGACSAGVEKIAIGLAGPVSRANVGRRVARNGEQPDDEYDW